MNGSPASKGPIETRLATKLRAMADDIRILKQDRLRIGKWRLKQNLAGKLVAINSSTGNTTILAPREDPGGGGGGTGDGFRPGTADYSAIGGDLDEEATADGTYALAIGNGSQASGEEAVAVGDWAEAQADYTLAEGSSARARRRGAVALGSGTGANQEGAVALGWNAAAGQPFEGGTGEGAIAIGDDSYTPVDGGMAIGVESFATGIDSAAVGPHAEAYDENSFAAGPRAAAVAPESTALGHRAHTEGDGAVAVGKGAIANYDDSWAMGRNAVTTAQKQGLLKADVVRVKPVTAAPAPSFIELYDAAGVVHILGVDGDTVTFDGVPIGGGGGGAAPEIFTFYQDAHLSGFGANVIGGEMTFGLPADFVEDSMEVFINGLAQAPTHGFYIDGTDLKVNPDTFAEWDTVYVRGWIVA